MRFRQRIAQFMYGRRGTDAFSLFLLVVAILLSLISRFFQSAIIATVLQLAVLAVIVYCCVRILSRDIYKRQKENDWYLQKQRAVTRWFRSLKDRWQQRKEYRFFRCPSCKTLLRVPKGKGKLLLTCRKCGRRFERKT